MAGCVNYIFLSGVKVDRRHAGFPENMRAAAFGIWSGISGLGLSIGPLIGGLIVEGAPWQMIFWVNVPIGLLALLFGNFWLAEMKGERKPLDLPGVLLIAAGLTDLNKATRRVGVRWK